MAIADKELAEIDASGMSLTDKKHAILNFFKVGQDIMAKYEIDPNVPFEISPFTGDVIIGGHEL